MWLAIWAIFAIAVLIFVGWTVMVLFEQKKAWSTFAQKNKLQYQPGKMMESPVVSGKLNKRRFSLYSGAQQTDDIRGQRFVTVIEFQMGQGMPTGAAIATREYEGFLNGLIFDQSYDPFLPEWSDDYILRTRHSEHLKAYLTKERLQILHGLFSMKNSACLFFFDELEAVLRIETTDPLRNLEHLEKIVRRLKDAVERLAPTEEEKERFRAFKDPRRTDATPPEPQAEQAEVPAAPAEAEQVEEAPVKQEEDVPEETPPSKTSKKKSKSQDKRAK